MVFEYRGFFNALDKSRDKNVNYIQYKLKQEYEGYYVESVDKATDEEREAVKYSQNASRIEILWPLHIIIYVDLPIKQGSIC